MLGFLSAAWLATMAHIMEAEATSTVKTELGNFLSFIVHSFFIVSFFFDHSLGSNKDRAHCMILLVFRAGN